MKTVTVKYILCILLSLELDNNNNVSTFYIKTTHYDTGN